MNVFGGARSRGGKDPRGPRGFPGKDSSINDFCTWLPNTILKQLEEHEEVCYILSRKNPENDLIRGRNKTIEEWKSRNLKKGNLVAVHPSSELVETGDGGYALSFQKNLYQFSNPIIECIRGYGYICITFKVDGEEEQALITNYKAKDPLKNFHEISVTTSEINIRGYMQNKPSQHTIQHDCRNWTTLFLDYTIHESAHSIEFTYILDNDPSMQGSFTFQSPIASLSGGNVGGRKDGTKVFSGALHGLEFYHTASPKPLPQSLKELLINRQQVKHL